MAKISVEIIDALRVTATNIESSSNYMWGHMGSCNCGNLAQVITKRSKGEIHAYAMQGRGDWNEQIDEYCGNTQMPIEIIIFDLLTFGFTTEDLKHLEKLSDPAVLDYINNKNNRLHHNRKEDVVVYLKSWANLLEEKLIETIKLPTFENKPEYA